MSELSKNNRRDFLRKGVLGVTLAASGSLVFTCTPSGQGEEAAADSGDTVKLLSPNGELVEVDRKYLKAAPKVPHVTGEEARRGIPGKKFVMVIDLAKCSNARVCVTACQKHHNLPEDKEWLNIKLMKDSKDAAPYWFPKQCFHCDNPPCVKVCPVDATFKRDDGLVLVDADRCIGCKFCMTACPYSTRVFNWGEPEVPEEVKGQPYSPETGNPRRVGTVEKCDFCPDMTRQGKLPPCVAACPNGVFYFGDENEDIVTNGDETIRFSELIMERAGYRYMEDLGTQPRVYYLPPSDRLVPVEKGLEDLPEEIRKRYDDVM